MIMMTELLLIIICPVTAVLGLSAQTTRYWDCCKASCSWSGKAVFSHPVVTCAKNGETVLGNATIASGCDGGGAYVCNNNQPWTINEQLAYGFAAAHIGGGRESDWCCACYTLTFTTEPIFGKQMVIQAMNTGGDLGYNHFDLQMPGGGVGLYEQGCLNQWDLLSNWGVRYGGISNESECISLPLALQRGCQWRFQWFQNADNPSIEFERVRCPKQLTDITGCIRDDDSDANLPEAPGATAKTNDSTSIAKSTMAVSGHSTTTATQTPHTPHPGISLV